MMKINVKSINLKLGKRSFSLGSNITRVVLFITVILFLTGCRSANPEKRSQRTGWN